MTHTINSVLNTSVAHVKQIHKSTPVANKGQQPSADSEQQYAKIDNDVAVMLFLVDGYLYLPRYRALTQENEALYQALYTTMEAINNLKITEDYTRSVQIYNELKTISTNKSALRNIAFNLCITLPKHNFPVIDPNQKRTLKAKCKQMAKRNKKLAQAVCHMQERLSILKETIAAYR